MPMPLLFILGLSPIPTSQKSLGGYESAAMKISEAKDISANDKKDSLYLLYRDYKSSIAANQAPMTRQQLQSQRMLGQDWPISPRLPEPCVLFLQERETGLPTLGVVG